MSPPVVLAQTEEAVQACERGVICQWFLDRTGNEIVATFFGVLIPDILRTLLIFAAAWFLARVVRRTIRRVVRQMVEANGRRLGNLRRKVPIASTQSLDPVRAAMRTETLGTVLRSLASITIWTMAVFVALGSLNTVAINLGPLIAGAGIVGVALGFGSQALVKDFLTGIFMLMEDQYGVGDIVDVGPATGVVEGITLRTTRLRDVEGVLWHVPHGEISRVGNLSQQWSRSLIDVEVAYSTDLAHAMEVIKRTADGLWHDPEWQHSILEEPEVWGVQDLGDSAVVLRLVVKTLPAKQWAVNRELRLRIKAAFDEAGIEMPFPQRTVWMHAPAPRQPAPAAPEAYAGRPQERTSHHDSERPQAAEDADDDRAKS